LNSSQERRMFWQMLYLANKLMNWEETLALLSESEHGSIKFPMHTALIFKEQVKVQGLREKRLSQPFYSKQHIKENDLLRYKDKIYIPQS
jgi:hypothetical protein